VGRLGSLRLGHNIRPQKPVGQIIKVKELRGEAVFKPDFVAATVSNGFVLSEMYYIGHAPMMP